MSYLPEHGIIDDNIEAPTEIEPLCQREIVQGTTGTLGIIFLIVNATLGAGLLNFPLAFDISGGVISAVLIQLGLLVLIVTALVILAHASDVTKTSSMQDTLAKLCGRKALIFSGISVTIYSFGCCLTSIILIGDQFERILATYYGMDYCHHWFLSRTFITSVTCTVFILPLSFFRRLDVLSYASSIGCITILYVIWLIIYESINTPDYPKPTQIWPRNISQALKIIPIICFAYQSHMTAIPTFVCMKKRNVCTFSWCALVSMLICFASYTIVGVFGYRTFGRGHVPSDILQGYSDKSLTLAFAIAAVAVKNFTTYPIVLFCGRNSLLTLFRADLESSTPVRVSVTLLWFILTLVTAIVASDLLPVINFMGVLSAMFIFMFPGICLMQTVLIKDPSLYLNKNRFLLTVAVIMITLGGFVAGLVFIQAVQDIWTAPQVKTLVTPFHLNFGASLC